MKKTVIAASAALMITACSGDNTLKEQSELYRVSMVQYQDYSCQQVQAEMRRISNLIQQESAATEKKENEYLKTALTAFAIARGRMYRESGDPESKIMMRLKSQYNALDQLAIQKSCIGEVSNK